MATEKTPLLIKSLKDEVVVKIPDDFDENNNNTDKATSLTYEQLVPYLIDPYWIRMRRIFFSLTLTGFFVILIAACISSFTATSSCRNMSPIMQPSLSDKGYVTNATNDEIPDGLVSFVLNGAEKIGLVSDNHL